MGARPLAWERNLRRWVQLFAVFVFSLALALLSLQFWIWRGYSLEASYYQAREIFGPREERNLLQLGAISNSLENFERSARYFSELLERNPKSTGGLANLAISLAQQQRWQRARPHFEAYFSLGGTGFDVMRWYGRLLESQGDMDQAVRWYYYALSAEPQYEEAFRDLVRNLSPINRIFECLSLYGAFFHGSVEEDSPEFSETAKFFEKGLESGMEEDFNLVALQGKLFYFPIQILPKGPVEYLLVNRGLEETVINEEIFLRNLMQLPEGAKEREWKSSEGPSTAWEMNLEQMFLGPVKVENAKVLYCPRCTPSVGRRALEGLTLEPWKSLHVNFLRVSQNPDTP